MLPTFISYARVRGRSPTIELSALLQRAIAVRGQYAALEQQVHGRSWTDEEIALGFVGDVGDLAKLILARNGVRHMPDADSKLAHELADCLWSVMVLASAYDIDLERAFLHTMDELEANIAAKVVTTPAISIARIAPSRS